MPDLAIGWTLGGDRILHPRKIAADSEANARPGNIGHVFRTDKRRRTDHVARNPARFAVIGDYGFPSTGGSRINSFTGRSTATHTLVGMGRIIEYHMALSAGARVGPYEILSLLGAGGMGEVWKAHDSRLGRTVAIKSCHHQFSDRFEREARIIAHLNHPNICTLYDVGPNYLVMELVEGQPLQGPVPLLKAVSYVSQICDALDAAHRAGVTHRDLKPGNVLLARDRVKLLDFGLAKIEPARITPDDETVTNALTARGTILGTPQYMAPEQIEGRTADSRSDIFALGCIIYELITGKRAFDGKSASVIAGAILAKDPAPMRSIEPLTPPLLEQIVASCLAKDPETRFQSARDVNLALAWLSAASCGPPARMDRNRVWLWVGIGALACGS